MFINHSSRDVLQSNEYNAIEMMCICPEIIALKMCSRKMKTI
jgi:hypothetical protein